MDTQFISQLLQDHGTSGVLAFSLGWFIIKKLPLMVERHLDSIDKHFDAIKESLSSLSTREDERHRELIDYIRQERYTNGRPENEQGNTKRGTTLGRRI